MARTTDARDKALTTAEHLFRTQGVAATGLAQIIAESGSPKGSFYFHFPGGKDQLAAEIAEGFARRGQDAITRLASSAPDDAAAFIRKLCAAFAFEMRASDYALGCPLQNIATEKAPRDPAITARLEAGFDSWVAAAAEHFTRCGLREPQALALALVAALEGARTIARVQQSDAVFHAISDSFAAAVDRQA